MEPGRGGKLVAPLGDKERENPCQGVSAESKRRPRGFIYCLGVGSSSFLGNKEVSVPSGFILEA